MHISSAQREMRFTFRGGFMGQLVSATLWLASAAWATWGTPRGAIAFLVISGIFIFPLTQLGLRLSGGPTRVSRDNALHSLGAQVAFVLPLSLPVVGAATLYRLDWFFPAFMIVLGAHYVPFVFLYGMRMFGALAGTLWVSGLALGLWIEAPFATGAWLTGAVLLVFALLGRRTVLSERERGGSEREEAGRSEQEGDRSR